MKGRRYKLAQSANIKYGMYPRFVSFGHGARVAVIAERSLYAAWPRTRS